MKKNTWISVLLACALLTGCAQGGSPGSDDSPETNPDSVDLPVVPPADSDMTQEENAEEQKTDTDTETTEELTPENFFAELPERFDFSSGVGAWNTELLVAEDGTFHGMYHDSDMGDTGDDYPGGTVYICNFTGQFSQPEQLNEYCWRMNIAYIDVEGTVDEEYFVDGARYITAEPHGLQNTREVWVYLPGTPITKVPENAILWMHNEGNVLENWCLYNATEGFAFVGSDYPDFMTGE